VAASTVLSTRAATQAPKIEPSSVCSFVDDNEIAIDDQQK